MRPEQSESGYDHGSEINKGGRCKVVAILGDGQTAAQCIRIVAHHRRMCLALVIHHEEAQKFASQVSKTCATLAIPCLCVGNVNEPQSVRALESLRPDAIFNVNSWDIIRRRLLETPRDFIINFHNGPLPEYRGVNCPSWAIINQAKTYGVTWHLVSRDIDSGDIVAAERVSVDHDETAISLIFKCIDAGLKLLPRLLDKYAADALQTRAQQGVVKYYYATDKPNDGMLDFGRSYEHLSALVRGLNFRPFENPITYPKVMIGGRAAFVTEISRASRDNDEQSRRCGKVSGIDDRGVVVCASDGRVRLSGLMNENHEFVAVREMAKAYGLAVGDVLSCG